MLCSYGVWVDISVRVVLVQVTLHSSDGVTSLNEFRYDCITTDPQVVDLRRERMDTEWTVYSTSAPPQNVLT